MAVVVDSTPPICDRSHTAPPVTQPLTASSTLPTPKPTTDPAALVAAFDTPLATAHTVPSPVAPNAPATGEHTAAGTAGRATSGDTQCTP